MGRTQALIVIALLGWPLFKVLYYFATRFQVAAPPQTFDLIAFVIGVVLSFCVWILYSRFVRPKKQGTDGTSGGA